MISITVETMKLLSDASSNWSDTGKKNCSFEVGPRKKSILFNLSGTNIVAIWSKDSVLSKNTSKESVPST